MTRSGSALLIAIVAGVTALFTAGDNTTQPKQERVYVEPVLARAPASFSWYAHPQITDSGFRKNFRPTRVKDASSELEIMWLSGGAYNDYNDFLGVELWCSPRVGILNAGSE